MKRITGHFTLRRLFGQNAMSFRQHLQDMGRRGKFRIIVISGRVIQVCNLFPVLYRLVYFYADKLRLNDIQFREVRTGGGVLFIRHGLGEPVRTYQAARLHVSPVFINAAHCHKPAKQITVPVHIYTGNS